MLQFTVEIKYLKGAPSILAKFAKEADARDFITLKMTADAAMKTNVNYILLDLGEEIATFDANSQTSTANVGGSSGQGQSSSQGFRPNPLNTTLRPSGMPPSSYKTDDKDKK